MERRTEKRHNNGVSGGKVRKRQRNGETEKEKCREEQKKEKGMKGRKWKEMERRTGKRQKGRDREVVRRTEKWRDRGLKNRRETK
jgi:hypothetical protein